MFAFGSTILLWCMWIRKMMYPSLVKELLDLIICKLRSTITLKSFDGTRKLVLNKICKHHKCVEKIGFSF
ncbi:hypothetical protein HanRHA438_Chr06g0278501 [Helianthus annuus]|nr:hypothetical protein HanRHA438_Chr06g0278501 [Helianthus annuus]